MSLLTPIHTGELTLACPVAMPPGVYRNVPADRYHRRAHDVVNCGGLKVLIERTPRHYVDFIDGGDEDVEESDALAFGSALHCAILEPEVFAGSYRFLPASAPKDMRHHRNAKKPSRETLDSIAWWDDWERETAGCFVITAAELDATVRMASELRGLEIEDGGHVITAGELIDACEKEVTIYWVDEETGLSCKARFDLLSEELRFAGDLKSTLCASREAWGRTMFQRLYHVQAAHYCEGMRALGMPLEKFTFFAMEKRRPYVCATYDTTPADWELGYLLRQRAMRTLKRCLESDTWPGYTRRVEPCPMPAYAHYQLNDKETP